MTQDSVDLRHALTKARGREKYNFRNLNNKHCFKEDVENLEHWLGERGENVKYSTAAVEKRDGSSKRLT